MRLETIHRAQMKSSQLGDSPAELSSENSSCKLCLATAFNATASHAYVLALAARNDYL